MEIQKTKTKDFQSYCAKESVAYEVTLSTSLGIDDHYFLKEESRSEARVIVAWEELVLVMDIII